MTDQQKAERLREALQGAEKVFSDLQAGRVPVVSYRAILVVCRSALEATK